MTGTLLKSGPDAQTVKWLNGTGGSVSGGTLVRVGNQYGWLVATTADGEYGAVKLGVQVRMAKDTGGGTAFVVNEQVAYDSTDNTIEKLGRANTKEVGTVLAAAGDSDTTVDVLLGVNGGARVYQFRGSPTAGEDTANSADFDTGFGAVPAGAVHVTLQNSAGLSRACTYTLLTSSDAGKIRIAEANLASTDVVNITAYEY